MGENLVELMHPLHPGSLVVFIYSIWSLPLFLHPAPSPHFWEVGHRDLNASLCSVPPPGKDVRVSPYYKLLSGSRCWSQSLQFIDGLQCIFLFMSKILIWVHPVDLVFLSPPYPPSGIVAQIPSYWPHALAIWKGMQSCHPGDDPCSPLLLSHGWPRTCTLAGVLQKGWGSGHVRLSCSLVVMWPSPSPGFSTVTSPRPSLCSVVFCGRYSSNISTTWCSGYSEIC